MTTPKTDLTPKAPDTVSVEELRQRELDMLIDDQRADLLTDFTVDDAEPGDEASLLDPLVAYAREGERMAAAGPRRRVTADDLDRR